MGHRPPALAVTAARLYKEAITRRFGSRIRDVRIFGSMARGEARPDSDLDLLVLLDHRDSATFRALHECLYDVYEELDYPFVISPRIMTEEHFQLLVDLERKLALDILAEGVAV